MAGRTVLIAGGAGGMGLATGLRLAADGERIALADLPGLKLDEAVAKIAATGAKAIGLPLDIRSVAACRESGGQSPRVGRRPGHSRERRRRLAGGGGKRGPRRAMGPGARRQSERRILPDLGRHSASVGGARCRHQHRLRRWHRRQQRRGGLLRLQRRAGAAD
ncbi:MAG: SDR family NAD(P)-dependent oxidoreductase [Mesorhizobium sp.]|nr:MAG: SDR family NAD(P)-dependent oxidoreductase [Mesorhizobium sp.]RWA85324.1 MAG: SDR family NAD(P)-dependent oxidoreductase [Mesorhizobium sp.]